MVILGSTGSVGRLPARLVAEHPRRLAALGLSAGRSAELLAEQAAALRPPFLAVRDRTTARRVQTSLRSLAPDYAFGLVMGEGGLKILAGLDGPVRVVNALSGAAGLRPTLDALACGHTVALAHKDSLVMAGELVMATARRHGGAVIPVDSEHNAIWQCLRGEKHNNINKITLPCSGGPFRDGPADLSSVTPDQALAHPVWPMGKRISVDSATLVNKGKEIIEACHLFGLTHHQVEVVVHPEAAVHGLVTLCDGSVRALLGAPDMRLPLASALAHPDRLTQNLPPPDLLTAGRLTFAPVDHRRFPGVNLAREALDMGGTAPAALCAADDVAVDAFLAQKIPLTAISELIARVLDDHTPVAPNSADAVLDAHRRATERTQRLING